MTGISPLTGGDGNEDHDYFFDWICFTYWLPIIREPGEAARMAADDSHGDGKITLQKLCRSIPGDEILPGQAGYRPEKGTIARQ
jgi:hypothetical protein